MIRTFYRRFSTVSVLPNSQSPITPKPHFFNAVSTDGKQLPTYRIMDGVGNVIEGAELPKLDQEFAREIYKNMALLPIMDTLLYNIQRQGKISFYHGEEATVVGTAAALLPDDEVLGQYRELGVLLWRGWGIDAAMAQCFGNEQDKASKGRQMPVHWGSPQHHFHTISSPLATQIPQAAGVAYALRRDPARRGKNCAAVYFGEGAASEGDFHAGMLFASTISSPTLFIARNNGFAISTPATREARRKCVESGRGVLVEAMTYRVGHHSTSDDSFAYRARTGGRRSLFLKNRGWWSDSDEDELKEALKRHELSDIFSDVYGGEEPPNLVKNMGTVWEPWKAELKKFKDNGESLLGRSK
ncbi:branched-chain alpha-keto acid dehydrogenase E1-alpha subunit [Lactarius deliciosus]|nr:branched-chain alpha-keto acid dehydrogenase E1-alpha subunit [Lactarius deliciosus]